MRLRFRHSIRVGSLSAAPALMVMVLLSGSAAAQSAGTGWEAYYGCWAPIAAQASPSVAGAPGRVLCIAPVQGQAAVNFLTVDGGSVIGRVPVATARSEVTQRDGCSGWESAERGLAGRMYLKSEFICEGGLQRSSSGVIAMLSPSEWVDVQSVTVSGQTGTVLQRYHETAIPGVLVDELEPVMRSLGMAITSARVTASSPLSLADIVDVSEKAAPSAAEGWLLEKRQGFVLQSKHIKYLAEHDVPESIIDLVVALSYPDDFSSELSRRRLALYPTSEVPVNSSRVASEDYVFPRSYEPGYDRDYGDRHYNDRPHGYRNDYDYYSPFGFYYYGPVYGYGLGYGGPYYRNQRPVVVIIREGNNGGGGGGTPVPPVPDDGVRAVPGRGYTNGNQNNAGAVQAGAGSGTAGDVQTGSGSALGSTGRVAVPRPATVNGAGSNTSRAASSTARGPSGRGTTGSRATPPSRTASPPPPPARTSSPPPSATTRTAQPRNSGSSGKSGSSSSSSGSATKSGSNGGGSSSSASSRSLPVPRSSGGTAAKSGGSGG